MKQADVLYRAFLDYRKQTSADVSCVRAREAARESAPENDKLVSISTRCIINNDWVDQIYEGLPYVEKAILEERQFIRQQGEVVPIEKAKRVSKGSVEHLARHSEMMTHEPKEEGHIVPDKLYVVERLSDYAVYENRFLYMMLCYLRDFIEVRYSKIIELGNTYSAELRMDKEYSVGKRSLRYKLLFCEGSKEDPYGMGTPLGANELLQRIEEERHLVAAYLMTPLMKKVSEAPLLRPPVTRTNVLMMNVNFKKALELYDYVASYSEDGYTIEYVKNEISPFFQGIGDDFAELPTLTAFLAYRYGRKMGDALRASYDEEEARRRDAENEAQIQRLEQLREKIRRTGEGAEEYMLMLEERNLSLEEDRIKLGQAEARIVGLEGALDETIDKQNELVAAIDALRDEKARIISDSESEKRDMTSRHATELSDVRRECGNKISELNAECEREVSRVTEELSALREEDELLRAELRAQKQINGSIVEEGDFTSRERFEELEKEYAALGKLLDKEWKKTKKKIRKRVLWNK